MPGLTPVPGTNTDLDDPWKSWMPKAGQLWFIVVIYSKNLKIMVR